MTVEMTCEKCGQPFYCYPSEVESGRKYCSLTCRSADRFDKPLTAASRTPVNFTCKECSKPFVMMQSYLTAYRKKFDREPMYCSNDCSYAGRKKDADARNTFTCTQCGKVTTNRRKPGGRRYAEQKFCNTACKAEYQRQTALKRFQEEGPTRHHMKRHGYLWVSVPSLVTGKKHAILQHRYVMSKALGRPLTKDETVHHIDGCRQNNEPGNLRLFSSRHGPGQEVAEKVQWSIDTLRKYPEFAQAQGWALTEVPKIPIAGQREIQDGNPIPAPD